MDSDSRQGRRTQIAEAALPRRGIEDATVRADLDIRAFSRMVVSALDGIVLPASRFVGGGTSSLMNQEIESMKMVRVATSNEAAQ
jgi:hypothetical protein